VRTAQFQFTPNDLALASLVVAMFALCWVPSAPSGSGERRSARGRAFLCGVAAGLAIGTKPLVAPLVAMAGVAWMWRTRRAPRAREGALAHAAVFALGAVLFGSFWYARNWIVAGNPVFPAMVGPFEGPFTPSAQASTSLMRFIDESGHLPEFWDDLFRGRLNWPYEVGVTSMAGYALALWGLAWDRDRTRRGQRLLLLVAGLTYLAMFPYQPFSGTVNRPDAPIAHVVRYLMIPFVLGLVLVPSLLAFLRPRGPAPPLAAVPAVPRPVLRWAGLAALLLLALSTPFKARATSERLFEERHGAPVGPMWRAIENIPDGSLVTMLSNDPTTHAMFYPLFGRRWQHTPVAIYGNGMPRRALHEVWRDEPSRWWWEFDVQRRTPARLLHNLRLSGVDYVLVTRWPRREDDAAWPVSREILLGSLEESARVFAGGYAEIWDVNGERKDQAE
jgi:hypothetical protein